MNRTAAARRDENAEGAETAETVDTPVADVDTFVRRHGVGLTRFAYVLTGDRATAEDLVQDAYLALHRRFGPTITVAAPVAYARRVIVNAHTSRVRRRSHTEVVTADPTDRRRDVAGDGGIDDGAQDEMWHLLATLPDRQRAVLVMRFYLDLPDPEIATSLGCREGTVRSLASRGLATLRVRHSQLTPEGRS